MSLLDIADTQRKRVAEVTQIVSLCASRTVWFERAIWPIIAAVLNKDRIEGLLKGGGSLKLRYGADGPGGTSAPRPRHRSTCEDNTFSMSFDISNIFHCGMWLIGVSDIQDLARRGVKAPRFGMFFVGTTNPSWSLPHIVEFPGPEVDLEEWAVSTINKYFEYWIENATDDNCFTNNGHYFRWDPKIFDFELGPYSTADEYNG